MQEKKETYDRELQIESNQKKIFQNQRKWDLRFLSICDELAKWSSCLSRQYGAVLVRDKVMISTGYNGPPRGVPHCSGERGGYAEDSLFICPRKAKGYKSGEGLHLCPAIHAEENAILNAARIGVEVFGSTMYMNCSIPCKDCLKKIINVGIVELVCISFDLYDDLSRFLIKNSNLIVRDYEGNPYKSSM